MGRIAGEVSKEGLAPLLLFDPLGRLAKKHVSAIALRLFEATVVEDGGVKIGVARGIAAGTRIGLSNTSTTMNENLVKSTVVRAIGRFVSEMPLAKDAGRVTGRLEDLCQRDGVKREAFTLENGVSDAVLEFVPAREERSAGGGTGRTHMKIGESNAFVMKPIDIGRFENRVPMTRHISVALVVCEDEDDVWSAANQRIGWPAEARE
jgi:hypothetical protein